MQTAFVYLDALENHAAGSGLTRAQVTTWLTSTNQQAISCMHFSTKHYIANSIKDKVSHIFCILWTKLTKNTTRVWVEHNQQFKNSLKNYTIQN